MAGAVTRQTAGGKHQTDHETPDAKRPKTEKQTTLEESFDVKKDEKDGEGEVSGEGKNGTEKTASKDEDEGSQPDGKDQAKEDNGDKEDASEDADAKDKAENSHAKDTAIRPGADDSVPSNILEKGLIYFFVRARVNIDSPSAVDDLARSFMLLRPMPLDARLGKGTVPDASNARLLALPKKVFPASGRDRFMVFVEKSGVSYEELKKEFLDGEDYDTKTAGQRHTPAATPVGEGVYAVTTTGRESHLAYMMTLPEKLGQAQEELGLKEKGSFILSTKNPQHGGPANATLSTPPAYPKEILDDFRTLRWLPTKTQHLDYVNSQILFIGESSGLDKATEKQDEDGEEPRVVLERLEEEDVKRMKGLPGGDAASIFQDLHADAEAYPKLMTSM